MSNIISPSTALLPMDDIAELLKLKYSFKQSSDNAPDTEKVAGVDADKIAVAATNPSTGDLIADRSTVANSLKLGNVNASEYIKKADISRIEGFTKTAGTIFADEFASLRDEFYQLRGELAKQGLINGYNLYQGFQDYFKNSDPKYLNVPICGIKESAITAVGTSAHPSGATIYPEAPTEFNIGDYFVIQKEADPLNFYKESNTLVKVVEKNKALGSIVFEPALNDLDKNNVKLYKSLGQYNKGTFSFSKTVKNAVVNREKQTMLNDDPDNSPLLIDSTVKGFATKFKVPNTVAGALSKFSILAQSFGVPGNLVCTLIKMKDGIVANGEVIATAKQIPASQASFKQTLVDFDFFNESNGTYPILEATNLNGYCFLITCLNATSQDYWQIASCSNNSGEVQTNHKFFMYNSISRIYTEDPSQDLYFILTTKEIAEEEETAFREGLYTAKFSLPDPIEVSRARLTLRINREGNYITTSSAGAYHNGSIVSIGPQPGVGTYTMSYGTGIGQYDTIVIGNDIKRINNINNTQLTLAQGAYIKEKSPVYRCGYEILLRVAKVDYDETSGLFMRSNEKVIPLPLTAVLPDGKKVSETVSDRLIFEGMSTVTLTDIPAYVNTFELQIKWNSNFPTEALNNNKELIGRIADLTLSFDKTY